MVQKLMILCLFTFLLFSSVVFGQAQKGIDNAIERASGEVKQEMIRVRSQLQERAREQIRDLSQIQVQSVKRCSETVCSESENIIGTREVRLFGMFRTQRRYEYELLSDGSLKSNGRFFDLFYSDIED